MITINADLSDVPVEWHEYSDGALTCKVSPKVLEATNYITLKVDPKTPAHKVIPELELVLGALYYLGVEVSDDTMLNLSLPYLPYARANIVEEGSPNAFQQFAANLYNMHACIGGFNNIELRDPRLDEEVLDYYFNDLPVSILSQWDCFSQSVMIDYPDWDCVMAVSQSREDRAEEIANKLDIPLLFSNSLPNKYDTVLICGDILDDGEDFLELVKDLDQLYCPTDIYVTHLIASKGLDIFGEMVDNILYHQIVGNSGITHADIDEFNVTNIMV